MVARALIRLTAAALLLSWGNALAQTASPLKPDLMQETYGDWIVRCWTAEATEGVAATGSTCEIAQELTQSETKQRVLAIALQAMPDSTAALTLITPFGLRLPEGVAIDIAADRLTLIGFRTCLSQGCIASGALDGTVLDRLVASEKATFQMMADTGQPFVLEVSLKGFAAAWSRLVDLSTG